MIAFIRVNNPQKQFYISTAINSFGFFFISYLAIRGLIFLLSFILVGNVGMTYQRVFLDIIPTAPSSSGIWTYSNIISIYLSPIIVAGFVFFLVFILYKTMFKYVKGTHKLLWLWILIQSSVMSLGAIIASVTSQTGAYYAFLWMYIPYSVMMVVSLLCFIVLIILGWLVGKNFLYFSESRKYISNLSVQKKHLFYSLFLPSVIGHLMIFLFQYGVMDKYNKVLLFCGVIATIPVLFQTTKIKITLLRNDRLSSISIICLAGIVLGIAILFIL